MHDLDAMPERLAAFLAEQEPDVDEVVVLTYQPVVGGYSRLTAKADVRWRRGGVHEEVTFYLRGDPPPGVAIFHTDRDREWDALAWLTASGSVPMPAARWYDGAGRHLGTKAMVIDVAPGESFQACLPGRESFGDLPDRLCDLAAAIHTVDLSTLPASIERPASWSAYMDAAIGRWRAIADAHVESAPFVRYLAAWMDAHRPPEVPLTLVHGDFENPNVMLGPDGTVRMIDWEFVHVGDPREDLGFYRIVGQAAPPDLIGVDAEAWCARYRSLTGLSEAQLNPVAIGYFSILSAVVIFEQLLAGLAAFATGATSRITAAYQVTSATVGHANWLTVSKQLEAALDALQEAHA